MSWDIYYHVHLAQLYLTQGFTYWDPLTVAPYGRPIAYPPVFHFLLAALSYLFGIDPFQVARYLQPVMAFALVLSVTYVTYRLFGFTSGVSAGILTMFSLMTFNRAFFASPGTLALTLMPLILYAYYQANENGNFKYLLVSSLLSGVVFLTHDLTAFMVLLVVFTFTVAMIVLKRTFNLKYLVIFLFITAVIALLWWGPLYVLYHPQFTFFPGYPLPISEYYVRYLGIIPTLLAITGGLSLLNKGEDKGVFILVWVLSTLLLSRAYLIGLNVIPVRVLEVASYPMIILAGYGLAVILEALEKRWSGSKDNSSRNHSWNLKRNIKVVVLVSLTVFTLVSGAVFADSYTPNMISPEDSHNSYIFPSSVHLLFNPLDHAFKFQVIADRYGNLTLAKNREGVMEWLKNNADHNTTIYSVDSYMDTIIVSTTGMKVMRGGFSESIPPTIMNRDMDNVSSLSQDQLVKDNIKYLLLRSGMSIPTYAREVYRNGNYIVCEIN